MKNHFAVYEHIRPDTGEVFYVGKGAPSRVRLLAREYNKHHTRIRAKLHRMGLEIEVRIVWGDLPDESALALEKMRIAYLRAIGVKLVNLTDGGEGVAGYTPTDEQRKRMREIMLGREFSDETRRKLSEAATAAHARPAVKERFCAAAKAAQNSPEVRAKNSASKKGRTISAEQRASISATLTGKTQSAESNAKRSAALTGIVRPPETRAKISAARKGKTFSDAHRAALSASWERRRAAKAAQIATP